MKNIFMFINGLIQKQKKSFILEKAATTDIIGKLQKQLSPRYINVTGFQITNINYSKVFEQAIESKVTAEQEALRAKNKTVQMNCYF